MVRPRHHADAQGGAGGDFDRYFTEAMIAHHHWGMEAAKASSGKLQRPELQNLARELADADAAHVRQLQAWRQSWYGAPATGPS